MCVSLLRNQIVEQKTTNHLPLVVHVAIMPVKVMHMHDEQRFFVTIFQGSRSRQTRLADAIFFFFARATPEVVVVAIDLSHNL